MKMRRSLITVSFSVVATAVAVFSCIVSCGPGNNGTATVNTTPNATIQKVLESCKDEIRRYDSRVDDVSSMCIVKDPQLAVSYAENLTRRPLAIATPPVTPSGAPIDAPPSMEPGAKPASTKLPYESVRSAVRYAITSKDRKLQVTMKLGVAFPANTPDMTKQWSLWVVNDCTKQITTAWSQSRFDVELNLPLVVEASSEAGFDQVLNLAGPKRLEPQSYPAFPMTSWPDRARLMPRASEEDLAACKLDRDCLLTVIKKANAPFCRDYSLVVGNWLGLNREANETAGSCTQGAFPMPLKNDSFVKVVQVAGGNISAKQKSFNDARFSSSDLRKILAPACKSAMPAK